MKKSATKLRYYTEINGICKNTLKFLRQWRTETYADNYVEENDMLDELIDGFEALLKTSSNLVEFTKVNFYVQKTRIY